MSRPNHVPQNFSGFEFWGIQCPAGKKVRTQTSYPNNLIHISGATLGDDAKDGDKVRIHMTVSDDKGSRRSAQICTLVEKYQENAFLDLVVPGTHEMEIHAKGGASISLSGYLQPLEGGHVGVDEYDALMAAQAAGQPSSDPLLTQATDLGLTESKPTPPTPATPSQGRGKKRARDEADESPAASDQPKKKKKKRKKKKKNKQEAPAPAAAKQEDAEMQAAADPTPATEEVSKDVLEATSFLNKALTNAPNDDDEGDEAPHEDEPAEAAPADTVVSEAEEAPAPAPVPEPESAAPEAVEEITAPPAAPEPIPDASPMDTDEVDGADADADPAEDGEGKLDDDGAESQGADPVEVVPEVQTKGRKSGGAAKRTADGGDGHTQDSGPAAKAGSDTSVKANKSPKKKSKKKRRKSYSQVCKGIEIKDTKAGNGNKVKNGDKITVFYCGQLDNGSVFDKCLEGKGFTFTVGKGDVIDGWDKGVIGMQAGTRRKLKLGPNMGYGSEGAGDDIPPNANLTFTVEVKSIA